MGMWPIIKTSWKYFPNKKGFLTGFILSVFGLCPMVFTSIADAVINPEGISTEKDGFYNDEISMRTENFSLIMAITMGACGILSQILMFPIDNVVSLDINNDNKNADKIETHTSNEIEACLKDNENTKQNELEGKNDENKDENLNEPFMQAFKSMRFHLFNIMSFGTLCKYILYYIFYSFCLFFN